MVKKIICLVLTFMMSVFAFDIKADQIGNPKIDFEYLPEEQVVVVKVSNTSTSTLQVFDSIGGKRAPYFLSVKITATDGTTLSNGDNSQDGFVSSNTFASTLIRPPVSVLDLKPSEQLVGKASVKDFLRSFSGYLTNGDLNGNCYVFKLTVFLDADLSKSTTQESLPICP